MKHSRLLLITLTALSLTLGQSAAAIEVSAPEAPFSFAPLQMYDFPRKDFPTAPARVTLSPR